MGFFMPNIELRDSADSFSGIASGDLTGKAGLFVNIDSNGEIVVCSAAGEDAIGVLLTEADERGKPVLVQFRGIAKVVAGGSITAGAYIKSTAAGKADTAVKGKTDTSDSGAAADPLLGSNVVGRALTGGSSDTLMSVVLTHSGAVPTTAA